jgi:hypothetical protein
MARQTSVLFEASLRQKGTEVGTSMQQERDRERRGYTERRTAFDGIDRLTEKQYSNKGITSNNRRPNSIRQIKVITRCRYVGEDKR